MYGYYQDYVLENYPNMMYYEPMKYPDIYYKVYPYVQRKCDMMDRAYNPVMQPYPSYEMVEQMTDEICNECLKNHPELVKEYSIKSDSETEQVYGPRGLFRSLVGILLIRELLDRRRRRGFFGYGPGYSYGPWYNY